MSSTLFGSLHALRPRIGRGVRAAKPMNRTKARRRPFDLGNRLLVLHVQGQGVYDMPSASRDEASTA